MPSDEMVEAAARVLKGLFDGAGEPGLLEHLGIPHQELARAALLAAEAVRERTHVSVPRAFVNALGQGGDSGQ